MGLGGDVVTIGLSASLMKVVPYSCTFMLGEHAAL